MKIHYIAIDDIQEASYNPRKIDNYQFKGLVESIRNFGCTQPLIINKTTNNLISGHQRLKAMRELKYKDVPVIYVELDELKEKALNITMNNKHITGDFTEELNNIMAELESNLSLDFLINLNLDTLIVEEPKQVIEDKESKEETKDKKVKLCPHCGGEL